MRKCDDCEDCATVCARWVEANRTAIPGDPGDCGTMIQAALATRPGDPYMNDRDYPRPEDWANGRNHFARPNPEAPWVKRHRPEPLDALEASPPRGVRCRRLAVLGNPERIA